MSSDSENLERLRFFGALPGEFDAVAGGWGWPRFRGKQVRDWVYGKLVSDPARMTNLAARDRQVLAERVAFARSEITRRQDSADGTRKLLLTWSDAPQRPAPAEPVSQGDPATTAPSVSDASTQADRAGSPVSLPVQTGSASASASAPALSAETVMIPDADRRTACVSSQFGCPVGCTFCASGLAGVKGNLTADQIVEQVYRLNELLAQEDAAQQPPAPNAGERHGKGRPKVDASFIRPPSSPRTVRPTRITNIVFMGMGEPLANYNNVMQAIRILHDPECFNLGARRITISTVGVPSRIRDLAREELPLNLALSLHAPNEPLRRQLIPWANHFALPEILDACRYYFDRTGREITLEYILLHDVNDRPEHARQLAQLCQTLRANVNLIRYNEVEGLPFARPRSDDVMTFQSILRHNGVNAHVRKSRGRDIDAACGQLRRKQDAPSNDRLVPASAGATG